MSAQSYSYNSEIPIDCPDQDVYENSIETLWKNIIGNKLNDFISKYYHIFTNNDIKHLNTFLDQFNSLYEKELVFTVFDKCIENIGSESEVYEKLLEINSECKKIVNNFFTFMDSSEINKCIPKTACTGYDIGRVANKKVFILKKPIEIFSRNEDYLDAIGQILSNYHINLSTVRKQERFYDGFELTNDEKEKISENVKNNVPTSITMIEILTLLEKSKKHLEISTNLATFEILKSDSLDIINDKMTSAISLSFYLIGKLFSVIANQICYKQNGYFCRDVDKNDDPIKCFITTTGIYINSGLEDLIVKGFKRMALSHISHGMSPAELVARISSSVRTSYPIALIVGLSVRSGLYHGGAMQQAIPMIKEYFNCAEQIHDEELTQFTMDYVNNLFKSGKIFGFGHRIHKTPLKDELSSDPRALEYLEIIHDIFGNTNELELKLSNLFVSTIRKIKPSLGCNSDYAIALFCVLLNVPEEDAEGMFTMCRIPGLCARIVRELLGKANARRSPFPIILPYIEPKSNVSI